MIAPNMIAAWPGIILLDGLDAAHGGSDQPGVSPQFRAAMTHESAAYFVGVDILHIVIEDFLPTPCHFAFADLAVIFGRAVTVPLQPQIKRHNKGLMIDPANAVLWLTHFRFHLRRAS